MLLEAKEDEDGDVDILIEPTCPQLSDVLQALEVLRRYMIFCDSGQCIQRCINRTNSIVEKELSKKLKQVDIRDFETFNIYIIAVIQEKSL